MYILNKTQYKTKYVHPLVLQMRNRIHNTPFQETSQKLKKNVKKQPIKNSIQKEPVEFWIDDGWRLGWPTEYSTRFHGFH